LLEEFKRNAKTKDEVAQKGITCPQAAKREHRDFEKNSIPKGL
jgi:hypothetical protein